MALLAVLDACVLFKGKVADFLLHLAEAGLFDPVWSDQIHTEWMRNLQTKFGIPPDKIAHRRREMERAFPAANHQADAIALTAVRAVCVTNAQRKDAHVIATAIAASAQTIVTDNVADFADPVMRLCRLSKHRPDAFCKNLFEADRDGVIAGATAHRASMVRRPLDPDAYLDFLAERSELPGIAALLRPFRDAL